VKKFNSTIIHKKVANGPPKVNSFAITLSKVLLTEVLSQFPFLFDVSNATNMLA
jgi:hypothetical protein